LSDQAFARVCARVCAETGITLPATKHQLVVSRLSGRLRVRGVPSFDAYVRLLDDPLEREERAIFVDALTTHETSFYREPQHFPPLLEHARAVPQTGRKPRVWSAACSTGEEPWSVALTLGAALEPANFEVLGSDVSERAVELARQGLYPLERAAPIPPEQLKRFCLKGQGPQEGRFAIGPQLRHSVTFFVANLCELPPPLVGQVDVVLLRNVLIYFEPPQKRRIVELLLTVLRPNGLLIAGHAESLAGLTEAIEQVAPTLYQKRRPAPGRAA
jgi:chemotaxis protein methyltransferase CheR